MSRIVPNDAMPPAMLAFAAEYVKNGGNATAAATTAGYSPHSARCKGWQLLRDPRVQEAVRAAMFNEVERLAPRAMKALADALDDPTIPARDRIRAAEAILDRGSLKRGTRAEVSIEDRPDGLSLIHELQKARQERLTARPLQQGGRTGYRLPARTPKSARGSGRPGGGRRGARSRQRDPRRLREGGGGNTERVPSTFATLSPGIPAHIPRRPEIGPRRERMGGR